MDSALPKGWTAVGEEQPIAAGGLPKGWTAVGEEQPIANASKPVPQGWEVDPITGVQLTDPEAMKSEGEVIGAAGRGAAETVTGVGELIPGVAPYAARATQSLHAGAKRVPNIPEMLQPENLGYMGAQTLELGPIAGRAAGLIKAAPEGAGALSRAATAYGQGALAGGVYGGLSGFQSPTGDPNLASALQKKASGAIEEGLLGAAVGGALGAGGSLAKSGHGILSTAVGSKAKEAEAGAEALREELAGLHGKGQAAKEAEGSEALKKASTLSTELPKFQKEAERTTRGIESIEGRHDTLEGPGLPSREEKRAALGRGNEAPADLNADIRERVVERTRERARDAEAHARAQGAKAEDAKRFAAEQGERLHAAETAGDHLAQELTQSPRMTKVELGDRVQKHVDHLVEALERKRTTESGFAEALAEDKGQPKVPTGEVRAAISQIEQHSRNPEKSAILKQLNELITNKGGAPIAGAEGGVTVKEIRALTLRQADDLRKTINKWLSKRNESVANGGLGADKSIVSALENLQGILTKRMSTEYPNYGKALKKYADLSRPLDELTGKGGALTGTAKEMQYGDDFQMERGAVLTRLLSKTREGSEVLDQLIKTDPSLRESIQKFLHRELYGFEQAPKTVDAKRMRDFISDNEELLRRTNLIKEFVDTHAKLSGSEAEIAQAEQALKQAKTQVKTVSAEASQAEARAAAERSLREKAVGRLQETQKPAKTPVKETADAQAKDRAQKALERLKAQQSVAQTGAKEAETGIQTAQKALETAKSSAADYAKLTKSIGDPNTGTREVANGVKNWTKRLREDNLISAEQEQELDRKAREVIAQFGETDKARKKLTALYIAAGTMAAAYVGARGSEAVSLIHLISPGSHHR